MGVVVTKDFSEDSFLEYKNGTLNKDDYFIGLFDLFSEQIITDSKKTTSAFVIKDSETDQIVGFSSYSTIVSSGEDDPELEEDGLVILIVELETVYLSSEYRGKGYTKKLLEVIGREIEQLVERICGRSLKELNVYYDSEPLTKEGIGVIDTLFNVIDSEVRATTFGKDISVEVEDMSDRRLLGEIE